MRLMIILLAMLCSPAAADRMRIAITTSFSNSGLADRLMPAITEDTGIDIELVIVGTGQALRLGAAGDVDAVLVHAPSAEAAFVAQGHSPHRREIMFNDFVLIGPQDDPAQIANAPDAATALRRIADAQARFVSRGDDSGTHKRELALWEKAGIEPVGTWYKSVGQGMGASLNIARAVGAYLMADRGSWLNFAAKADQRVLFAGDPMLINQYAYMPISADKGDHIQFDLALRVESWLVSDRAKELINSYKIDGTQLFTFNARPE